MDIIDFFDTSTMSVHLKCNCVPMAKKGTPKEYQFEQIDNTILSREKLNTLIHKLVNEQHEYIESQKEGYTILQKNKIRILITQPPFSDEIEITAVRPVTERSLSDYHLSQSLIHRLEDAEGVLICGKPGQGKSTFARALALSYLEKNNVTKTIESPRDMVLPNAITQYALDLIGEKEIKNILLLARPDFTIFDEMRGKKHFDLYADLRLSGVGMVGITHGNTAIDAIERFIGKIELGMIPHIIDTIIFIDKGEISSILTIGISVKVPKGMQSSDLARPVVTVKEFESEQELYELYAYGDETIVVPVDNIMDIKRKPTEQDFKKEIKQILKNVVIKLVEQGKYKLYLSEEQMLSLKEDKGKELSKIKEKYSYDIEIESLATSYTTLDYQVKIEGKYIILLSKKEMVGVDVDIYAQKKYVLRAKIGKKNNIKVHLDSEQGITLKEALLTGQSIELRIETT